MKTIQKNGRLNVIHIYLKLHTLCLACAVMVMSVQLASADLATPFLRTETSGTQVTLSWDQVEEAAGYTLYYAPYPYGQLIKSLDMGEATQTSFDLFLDGAYYVGIEAYNDAGTSPVSNVEYFAVDQFEQGIIHDGLEQIRQQYNKAPALAAAYISGGSIQWQDATGTRKDGEDIPVTRSDRFHIGSNGKSMTAMLAARLIEEGQTLGNPGDVEGFQGPRLTWETTLNDLLPEVDMLAQYRSITLTQLLTHQSGIVNFETWEDIQEITQRIEVITDPTEQRKLFTEIVFNLEPEFEAGTSFHYNNAAYGITGYILETITGKPYESLIAEKIFAPLGLDSCGFGHPATSDEPDQPLGHWVIDDKGTLHPITVDDESLLGQSRIPHAFAPAGDIHCSIGDFASYVQDHLLGLDGHGRILQKQESYELLHSPISQHESGWYGGGWTLIGNETTGEPIHLHNGNDRSFSAFMVIMPERGVGVVCAVNSGDDRAGCWDVIDDLLEIDIF